jgi:hypothetical protein
MSKTTIYIHCKRDYKDVIDIRDYIVNAAINEGKTITVTCGSFPGTSIYTPEELKNPVKISRSYKANFGNIEDYKLHSYDWKFD